jgi:hypothetical protein
MQNIEQACVTALDSSINDAFKVSNDPTVQGWHAGMRVIDILDQLSLIYGQPTPAALEANDNIFRSLTSAADAPEVLFRRIEECAEKALLGQNPYTDKQLINNTIRLLLTTGLYIRVFEDWDQLADTAKTWIELRRLIQEDFSVDSTRQPPPRDIKDMPQPFHSSKMRLVLSPATTQTKTTQPKRWRHRWRH